MTLTGLQSEDVFADTLELHLDLQYLQVNQCSYSQTDGVLQITAMHLKTDTMRRILTTCAFVTKLVLNVDLLLDCAMLIAECVGNSLRALTINCPPDCSPMMDSMLQHCGYGLTSLQLRGYGVDDQLLQVVAQHCPLLEFLLLNSGLSTACTDVGMIAVINGCPHLQHCLVAIAQQITRKTLQAILDRRLRLKTLKLMIFNGATAAWFRTQCKEHQLLPVPVVSFVASPQCLQG